MNLKCLSLGGALTPLRRECPARAGRSRARTRILANAKYQGKKAKGGRGGSSRGGKRKGPFISSNGQEHLGSSLEPLPNRPFPGPPPETGPPLRVLPIGGLGEIGMNCMLVGVKDRYIMIDAGLMFPDFQDLGMQKILPDTSFIAQWRDKIEGVIITHGHEDHIGALPWVVPALDPSTPIYAGSFVKSLIERRLTEFSLLSPDRIKTFQMRDQFQCGPFQIQPLRVTHSIPDCCGLILRSEYGTIVHTGDWKIDESPVDGKAFDRELFDLMGKENVSLLMSDSTNVLSPGRTFSEKVVEKSLVEKVMAHQGKGRVICTQFASNIHRLHSVKMAADAAGRKICFVGMSLTTYLEAAWKDGCAPFDPREVVGPEELEGMNPNEVLIVTTGSQAEPRAALSLASRESSHQLKILPSDLVLYSAKVIPGNESRVTKMLNSLSMMGAKVVQGRSENLHTSGHAYQDELVEVMQYVKPQHFLPVHGEYAFLCEHAQLAREKAGVNFTSVIKNGQMLGVHERRNSNTLSVGSAALARVIGEVNLVNYYNDGFRGTGTAQEMGLLERTTLAFEGVVVAAIDVVRSPPGGVSADNQFMGCHVRVTTRGMWVDKGRLLQELQTAVETAVTRLKNDASLVQVERTAIQAINRACRAFNNKRPEVICVAYEHDPRLAIASEVSRARRQAAVQKTDEDKDEGEDTSSERHDETQRSSGSTRSAAPKPWSPSSVPSSSSSFQLSSSSPSQEGRRFRSLKEASASSAAGQELANPSQGGRRVTQDSRPPPLKAVPAEVMQRRRAANPRDAPKRGKDYDYD